MSAMLTRAILLVAAAAAIAFGAHGLHDRNACDAAGSRITTALFREQEPAGGLATQQRRLEDACDDPAVLAAVSSVMTTAGRRKPALALAYRATRKYPRSFPAWVALGQALERTDPAAAAAARREARTLNPLGLIPRATGAGAARRAS